MIEADFHLQLADFALAAKLELPARGVTALFGPSGAGKSTVLRCLAGLSRPQRGRLVVNGNIWQDENNFVPPHSRAVGMVFQDLALFPHLNVQQNLDFGANRCRKTKNQADPNLLELLGIAHLLQRRTETLSGGEKQRVAIARALYSAPELLLLDEPLAALDAARKAELLPYLENLHEQLEIPVVYVSHAPVEVVRLADHIVLLDQGRITRSGPALEVFPDLENMVQSKEQAFAMLLGRIQVHDDGDHLSAVALGDATMWVRRIDKPVGSSVRLRVFARDVSLTRQASEGSSILNTLPTCIESMEESEPGRTLVKLQLGENTLYSRITSRSARTLNLQPGQQIYAQIKGVAPLE